MFLSFLTEVKRIGTPTYVPNETDVLHAREKVTGITEIGLQMGDLS
jgi:guanine nucleotide-binding protein G(i) subunit alpha